MLRDVEAVAASLALRPADAGANVVLAEAARGREADRLDEDQRGRVATMTDFDELYIWRSEFCSMRSTRSTITVTRWSSSARRRCISLRRC
jgi:hypothetical protein